MPSHRSRSPKQVLVPSRLTADLQTLPDALKDELFSLAAKLPADAGDRKAQIVRLMAEGWPGRMLEWSYRVSRIFGSEVTLRPRKPPDFLRRKSALLAFSYVGVGFVQASGLFETATKLALGLVGIAAAWEMLASAAFYKGYSRLFGMGAFLPVLGGVLLLTNPSLVRGASRSSMQLLAACIEALPLFLLFFLLAAEDRFDPR